MLNLKKSIFYLIYILTAASIVLAADSLQDVIKRLRSKDEAQRRQAAEELSRLRDPRSIPALIPALSDKSVGVRASIARTLGLMRARDANDELIRVVKRDNSPQVRQSAVIALGFIAEPDSIPVLINALKDPHNGTRFASCQALGSMKVKEAVGPLCEALKDESVGMRRSAASALGSIGDPSCVPELRKALKDDDSYVRSSAADSLGIIGDKDSVKQLKKLLKDDVKSVRVAAAGSLGRLGDKSGLEAALDVLEGNEDVAVRSQAARAIADIGDVSAIPNLKKVLEETEDDYLKQAVNTSLEHLRTITPVSKPGETTKTGGKKKSKTK